MFRKICITAIVALAIVMTVQGASAKQIIRVGMGDAPDSDQGYGALFFKELVESESNGEIEVQLFPGGQLGTETEMLQNTRMGTLDLAYVGIGNVVPFVKELGTLTMPYLIENHYDAIKATTGSLASHWSNLCIKKGGFRILHWGYSSFRVLTNSKKPVNKLADIKGMKVRIPQNKILMATYKAWGANPVPMAWSETFTALQQGVVDGQDNPYIVNYTSKFQEVQDYLSEVHYQYSLQPMIVGERTWKKWDAKTREIIGRAALETQQYWIAYQILEAEKAKEGMIKAGVKVSVLEDEEKWKEIAKKKVWPVYYDFIGGKENIDLVLKTLGKK